MGAVRKLNTKAIDEKLLSWFTPFRNLELEQLKQLAEKFQMRHVPAERVLFRRGDNDLHAYFLVAGEIELSSRRIGQLRLKSGTEAAREPIAEFRPRRVDVKTTKPSTVMFIDRHVLDLYIKEEDLSNYEVSEIEHSDESDWMTRFLCSLDIKRIPAKNIQDLMLRMEELPMHGGANVFEQYDPDDHYYILKEGRCLVTRRTDKGDVVRLAELSPGCGFGEEAIISQGRRNASVTMTEDGTLMRLSKVDFLKLLVDPAIDVIIYPELHPLMNNGAKLLDVRSAKNRKRWLRGSMLLPLTQLRDRLGELDRNQLHIIYCDDGRQSAAAAFLLIQYGFNACILQGGLTNATRNSGLMEAQATDGSELLILEGDADLPPCGEENRHSMLAGLKNLPGNVDNSDRDSLAETYLNNIDEISRELDKARQEAERDRQTFQQNLAVQRERELASTRAYETRLAEQTEKATKVEVAYQKLAMHYRRLRNALARSKAETGAKHKELYLTRQRLEQRIGGLQQELAQTVANLARSEEEWGRLRAQLEQRVYTEQEQTRELNDQLRLAQARLTQQAQDSQNLQSEHARQDQERQQHHEQLRHEWEQQLADLRSEHAQQQLDWQRQQEQLQTELTQTRTEWDNEKELIQQSIDQSVETTAENHHLRQEVSRLQTLIVQQEKVLIDLQLQQAAQKQQRTAAPIDSGTAVEDTPAAAGDASVDQLEMILEFSDEDDMMWPQDAETGEQIAEPEQYPDQPHCQVIPLFLPVPQTDTDDAAIISDDGSTAASTDESTPFKGQSSQEKRAFEHSLMDNRKDKHRSQTVGADEDLKQTQEDIMRLKKRLEAQKHAATAKKEEMQRQKQNSAGDLAQNVYDDEYYTRIEQDPNQADPDDSQKIKKSNSTGWLSDSSLWESTLGLRADDDEETFEDGFTGRVSETSQVPVGFKTTPPPTAKTPVTPPAAKPATPKMEKPAAPAKSTRPAPAKPTSARTPSPLPQTKPEAAPNSPAPTSSRPRSTPVPPVAETPSSSPGRRSVFEARPLGSGPISQVSEEYSVSHSNLKAHPGLKKAARIRLLKKIAIRGSMITTVLALLGTLAVYLGAHHHIPVGKEIQTSLTKLQKSMGSNYGIPKKTVKKASKPVKPKPVASRPKPAPIPQAVRPAAPVETAAPIAQPSATINEPAAAGTTTLAPVNTAPGTTTLAPVDTAAGTTTLAPVDTAPASTTLSPVAPAATDIAPIPVEQLPDE